MAYRFSHLLVAMLACYYLVSSYAMPASRLSNLHHGKGWIEASETTIQNQMASENYAEDVFIEGRMDIEKNDYGPTGSNPVHTPKPPRI